MGSAKLPMPWMRFAGSELYELINYETVYKTKYLICVYRNRKLVDVDGHYMQQLVKRCFPQSLCPTAENCSFCHGVE